MVPHHLYHPIPTSRYRHFRFALNFTTKFDYSNRLHHGASPPLPPNSDLQIPTIQVCTELYYQIRLFHVCTVLPPKNDSKERHSGAVCTRCWRTNCHRMKEMCAITVRNNRLHFGASTGYHSNLTHRNHHFCTVLLYRTTKHSKPAPN